MVCLCVQDLRLMGLQILDYRMRSSLSYTLARFLPKRAYLRKLVGTLYR